MQVTNSFCSAIEIDGREVEGLRVGKLVGKVVGDLVGGLVGCGTAAAHFLRWSFFAKPPPGVAKAGDLFLILIL